MISDSIAEDIAHFLLEHIETYEQLEILVLLHKDAGRGLSLDAVAHASRIPFSAAETALDGLARSGLIEASAPGGDRRWRYLAADQSTNAIIERLAQAYRERPTEFIKLMNANAIERVRTSAIRAFANAFVFGRSKRNG